MSNSTMALVFVIVVNLFLGLSQLAVTDMNTDGVAPTIFNGTGDIVEDFKNNDVLNTDDNQIKDTFPSSALIEPSSGNPFTDLLSSMKSWFSDVTGLKYIKSVIYAPYRILRSLNAPAGFAITIGTAWYALSLFIFISYIFGKD